MMLPLSHIRNISEDWITCIDYVTQSWFPSALDDVTATRPEEGIVGAGQPSTLRACKGGVQMRWLKRLALQDGRVIGASVRFKGLLLVVAIQVAA
jgi:hypothetical protein